MRSSRLSENQTLRALLITCSDSRVDPTLPTHTDPSELFILRNAGNMVPSLWLDARRQHGYLHTRSWTIFAPHPSVALLLRQKKVDLHGWVYDLHDGIIDPVIEMKAGTDIDPLYEYHNLQ